MPTCTVTGTPQRQAAASTLRARDAESRSRRCGGPMFSPRPSARSRGLADPVVQLAGLAPQSELAGADVARHALGGGADAGQFVIVDRAGAVHGDVVDEAALDQVDDVAVDAGAKHVRAHHQDAGRAARRAATGARRSSVRSGWANGGAASSSASQWSSLQIVTRSASGLIAQARAVEQSRIYWPLAKERRAAVRRGTGNWG